MLKYKMVLFFSTVCSIIGLCGYSVAADTDEVIFLHHSTGSGVYYQGEVSNWISDYNTDNGTAYRITARPYPNEPYDWENYPYDYWNLWVNGACDSGQSGIACLDTLMNTYNVIIYKHCFPGAAVQPDTGSPDIRSSRKSLENYKLQYRALRSMMAGYPDTKFIVWTLAPLHRDATNPDEALRAKAFVDWVRDDFLRENGEVPSNIFVFDFWGIVAESDESPENGAVNCLKYDYEKSHSDSDSHPNEAANRVAGPLLAKFIVDVIEGRINPSTTQSYSDGGIVTTPETTNTTGGSSSSGSSCFIDMLRGDV